MGGRARKATQPLAKFTVAKITRWAGMVVGVLIALTSVGLNMSAVFAAMAVLLVGIGFGLQKMDLRFAIAANSPSWAQK